MQRKRIFYLITRSEPGGAQSHVLELLRGLKDKYDLFLGTGEKGFLMDAAQDLGIPTTYFPSLDRNISLINDYKAYQEILSALKKAKPDLVHCHSSKAGILGRLAAHKLKIKCVFTAHGWAFAEGTPWSRKLVAVLPERMLAHWTNRIITVSESDRTLAMHYQVGSPEMLVTIHNGIANTSATTKPESIDKPVKLIMVARFAPPKNFSQLLDAVAGINHDFRLQLVGDGPQLEEMQRKSESLGLIDRVEFTGSRGDVDDLLAAADIFVLASDWEGFPICILEAMRAGLPVIASDVGGIHEAVVDGENGRLIPRDDIGALKESVDMLINNAKMRCSMGEHSRQRFERYFTTSKMLNLLEKQYLLLGVSPAA